jgi:hypothetical protein
MAFIKAILAGKLGPWCAYRRWRWGDYLKSEGNEIGPGRLAVSKH